MIAFWGACTFLAVVTMTTRWFIVLATTVIALFVALHATSELAIVAEADVASVEMPVGHACAFGVAVSLSSNGR